MKKAFFFFALGLLGLILTGCAAPKTPAADAAFSDPNALSSQSSPAPARIPAAAASAPAPVILTNEMKPDLLRPPENLFTLGPGDRIEIEIIGRPTSRNMVTV